MRIESRVSPEEIKKLVSYDAATGDFIWLPRGIARFDNRFAGKRAFTAKTTKGYVFGMVNQEMVYAHRVAWALANSEWPRGQVDHINGVRSDNRIANLRVVTNAENAMNKASIGKSGRAGVYWRPAQRKWSVSIAKAGKYHYLGVFSSFDEAVAARKISEIELGFHANHGRPAIASAA